MNIYCWCCKCERAFRNDGIYDRKKVPLGERGGYWCPFCGASPMDTLDWETFVFSLAAGHNYPDQPEDGHQYPLYPII